MALSFLDIPRLDPTPARAAAAAVTLVPFMIMMESIETIWPSLPENEKQRIISEHTAVHQDLVAQNKLVGAYSLPRAGARTVRKDASGQFSVTDGPPGNELFGAVYVIVAVSIEEALEWGKKLRFLPGANEVREIFHN